MSWEGKFEPLSPLHNSLEESWIFEDDFATRKYFLLNYFIYNVLIIIFLDGTDLLTDDIILNIEDDDKQTELLLELQQLQKDYNDGEFYFFFLMLRHTY